MEQSVNKEWIKSAFLISFIYFIVASLIGVLLRASVIFSIPVHYSNFLHTHSHIVFMGWVYNCIYILTIHYFKLKGKWISGLFVAFQIAIIGMLISFPLEGYGAFSIAFSTLHIAISFLFITRTYSLLKVSSPGGKWVMIGYFLMILSSFGPILLGPLSVLGYKHTLWYDLAIQFYLHFFYNGWFLFALFGIYLHLRKIDSPSFKWLVISIVPLFFTYVLIFEQNWWVRLLSIFGSVVYAIGMLSFLSGVKKPKNSLDKILSLVILISILLKCLFQLVVNIPGMELWIADQHHIIIGFIHLTFLGIITPLIFLLINQLVPLNKQGVMIYITGFILTEVILLMSFVPGFYFINQLLFSAATVLLISICWIFYYLRKSNFVVVD